MVDRYSYGALKINWVDGNIANTSWRSDIYFELDKPCENLKDKIKFIDDLLDV